MGASESGTATGAADRYDDRDIGRAAVTRLSELATAGTPRASSLLIAQDGRFLLGCRPPLTERGRILLRLTGIGGWAEGAESFSATVHREAQEETGSDVRLFERRRTTIVRSPDDIAAAEFGGEQAPVALVYRRFGTAPFDPWSEQHTMVAPVAVFAGALDHPPAIAAFHEHPFFMWVYPEQMIALADSDEPLEFLLADGAEILGVFEGDPRLAIVRLTDSIQALLVALGSRAYAFLGEIARLTRPPAAEESQP
jgi:8-oxo-dGTP pyrophosphatase MutT (NUDIX family)